jgi:hypothetical protein
MVSTQDKDRRPERWKYDQVPLNVEDGDDDDDTADDLDNLGRDKDALKISLLASGRTREPKGYVVPVAVCWTRHSA